MMTYDPQFPDATFVQLLHWRALHHPDKHAYTFLLNGETQEARFTYAELDQQARGVAALLQRNVKPGERVLLLYPPGLEYIAAIFGCWYAGMVAVPAHPPRPNQNLTRIEGIIQDADAHVALTTSAILSSLERKFTQSPLLQKLRWLVPEQEGVGLAARWDGYIPGKDTLALLQYTSGSTGTPKGVMVTHNNLIQNALVTQKGMSLDSSICCVSWLPAYHDMGLMGLILEPLFLGGSSILMAPASFLQQPFRWLQAISRFKANASGAPNFAFDICTHKVTKEALATLDLSTLDMVFTGSEPVHAETLEHFYQTFAVCGLRREALYPCYGMAEATLFLTGGSKQEPPIVRHFSQASLEQNLFEQASEHDDKGYQLVSCGRPQPEQRFLIVDPVTQVVRASNQVGEIWVASPNVAQGYWRKEQETQETFQAFTSDSHEGPFLRTGDLGFFSEGELFVTGRFKDLIILRGRNIYPQDIEAAVSYCHPALRRGCCAAFSVSVEVAEGLAVVQEVDRHYQDWDMQEVIQTIRQTLAQEFDVEVVAIELVKVGSVFKTTSGKIQRRACCQAFLESRLPVVQRWARDKVAEPQQMPDALEQQDSDIRVHGEDENRKEEITAWLKSRIAERIHLDRARIYTDAPFISFGLSSVDAIGLSGELEQWLGCSLSPTLIYNYPSIDALAKYLADNSISGNLQQRDDRSNERATESGGIAIIGLGCRFPQAENPAAFWELLSLGKDAISEVPIARWNNTEFYTAEAGIAHKLNTRWGGFISQVDSFDAGFFAIMPREVEQLDPQQRLLLEVAWETLEQAGINPKKLAGSSTGVFLGISSYDYALLQAKDAQLTDAYAGTGNAHSVAANRLSYVFDFRGPSMAIDTACSSSLVAVHQACQSLRTGECSLAIAGGVNLLLTPEPTIAFSQAHMMASDGHSKAFDASADGYVRSEGCGLVLLKLQEQALHDGDTILAVIRGSAVNQDGASNGLTAPNGLAQEAVIRQALASAHIDPAEVSYVETHGTGTILGDPIEVHALKTVLMQGRRADQPCVLGAVKSNIGHLEAASGVAGLIKTVLCLLQREIPPNLHFKQLNPYIDLNGTSFLIPTKKQSWPTSSPRIAGVSAFGFGGTNAHIVLEEASRQEPPANLPSFERSQHILALSAKSASALRQLTISYQHYLAEHTKVSLADLCFTANTGRAHFAHRAAFFAHNSQGLLEQLSLTPSNNSGADKMTVGPGAAGGKIVFLFSGQGSQYIGMARQLYTEQPVFRQEIDRCEQILTLYLEHPLLTLLFAEGNQASVLLQETSNAQPALFAIEYALAVLWRSWGIKPDLVLGHSVGEYVAACVAGLISLEDGLKLIATRGRLMQALPERGTMVAVFTDLGQLQQIFEPWPERVAVAAINGPRHVVLAGPQETLEHSVAHLESYGIDTRFLHVSHAFHSDLLAPMLDDFTHYAHSLPQQAVHTPLISNLTGKLIATGEMLLTNYWREQTRNPVQFLAGIQTAWEHGGRVFIEIGPDDMLTRMGPHCLADVLNITWLPSLKRGHQDWNILLSSVATLYTQGYAIDWAAFEHPYTATRTRLSLPTYPFERQRYWFRQATPAQISSHDIRDSGAYHSNNGNKFEEMHKENVILMDESQGKDVESILAPHLLNSEARKEQFLFQLQTLLGGLLHCSPKDVARTIPFIEMGADSIVLIDAVRMIEQTFGIKLPIRLLFGELGTLELLAEHLDRQLAVEMPVVKPASIPSGQMASSTLASVPTDRIQHSSASLLEEPSAALMERVMAQQLDTLSRVMAQQIDALSKIRGVGEISSQETVDVSFPHLSVEPRDSQGKDEVVHSVRYVAYQPLRPHAQEYLTERQQHHMQALIARLTERTQASKQYAQTYRPILADNRASAGFRFSIKEMLYPIVAQRSQDAYIWDLDGNRLLDVTMGFGVNLFGHNPTFIQEALTQQVAEGFQLGPQSLLAGEVSTLIRDVTGMERVTFCNSGTEAVMTAVRIARAVNGKSKIVIFSGSYHGTFDGILAGAQPQNKALSTPIAPGVPEAMMEDVLVLDYGSEQSLAMIREHASELAAVLVEPVQSRHPDVQPRAFLQKLRDITAIATIALIFDETITGFRILPGGAQEWFGVHADLATYGKIVGGGMPIGVVAGQAHYMDSIDGGMWQYGDRSYPQSETTFFAGTFCKHPLAMATARAVLLHIKREGAVLQERLNERTARMAATLNTYFAAEHVPITCIHFGSLFRFAFSQNMDLFFYHLLDKGVYIWEGRNCFLSTAHSDEDVTFFIQCVKESIREMREGDFLPPLPPSPSSGGLSPSSNLSQMKPFEMGMHRELLQQEHRTGPVRHVEDIYAFSLSAMFPLTAAQQQLWVACNLDLKESNTYVERVLLRLQEKLDYNVLRSAFQMCIERHEALRTVFSAQGDGQRVLSSQLVKIEIPLMDSSADSNSEKTIHVERWLQKEIEQSFDLVQGPLLRIGLLKEAEDSHLLIISIHHLIADGRSIALVLQDVAHYYTAFIHQQISQLPSSLQYRKYVHWQEQLRQQQSFYIDEAYWSAVISNAPAPALEVLFDHPRPLVKTFAGASERIILSEETYEALRTLGRQNGATPYMVLLATYLLWLHRLTGERDIIVGVPMSGRSMEGSEALVGHCVNVLPLRSTLNGSPTFREYLQSVKWRLLELYDHELTPLAMLERLWLEQPGAFHPISLSTIFNLEHFTSLVPFADVYAEVLPIQNKYAAFDLSVNAMTIEEQLHVEITYNTDLFEPDTIRRLKDSLQILLQTVTEQAEQSIWNLTLLSPDEYTHIVYDWNQTQIFYPAGQNIPQLFEIQVTQTPDAVALHYEDQCLTYASLNAYANQLAHHLQALGIGPETLVGLYLERSLEMVIGLLGVLKAGGAYVPLDPAYPAERIQSQLLDAQVSVLLTQQSLQSSVVVDGIRSLCLDSDWSQITSFARTNLALINNPDNLAYIIYTSGSTGVPKGVMVTHNNVLRLFTGTQGWYHFQASDTWSLFHSYAFDFSVWEVWGALLYGGSLVVVPYWVGRSPDSFYHLLAERGVTVLNQTPSAFRQLMEIDALQGSERDLALRLVIFGGEALEACDLAAWVRHHGEKRPQLVNMYGITETTVHVTYRPLTQADVIAPAGSLIGAAIADLQLYILDSSQHLMPIGVPGELYVGGMGVARGYLHRPALTAERFIPHPWSQKAGARLYRTGDLVRYRADGDIEYLGRVDAQVKLRGFRIEPGEIETTLRKHPTLQEAIVIVREDVSGEKCLVAYVVVGADVTTFVESEVRQYLRQTLPEYMVPMFFVPLTMLPLTPNGKVDRRALPVPQPRAFTSVKSAVAQTALEEIILDIYRDILGVEQLGTHESFFDLGGHSLLATQVVSRIRNLIHTEIPLRCLFEAPSIAELALQIEHISRHEQLRTLPPLEPVSREQTLPLSFAQERLWFLQQLEPTNISYHMPAAFRLSGPLSVKVFERCLQAMVQRHENLRTRFAVHAGQPTLVIDMQPRVHLLVVDLERVDADQKSSVVSQLLHEAIVNPFDLSRGPLLRIGLLRIGREEHMFYAVMHHILFDAWATSIFLRELPLLYQAFFDGNPSPLPPLSLHYVDFAHWQRNYLKGEVLNALVDYWTEQLRGARPLELPTDRPRTKEVSSRGALYTFKLPAQLIHALRVLSRQEGVTLFMTLLTAFQVLLYRYTEQQDLVIGTDIANRMVLETEGMIGFFVNLLVLRLRLSIQATVRETVKSIRTTVLDAYAHQDLPFEKLVDALQLSRESGHTPLVNVLFVLQNVPPQSFELPGITVSQIDIELNTTKFDLALFLVEDGQELSGSVNYRTDLFDVGRIERFIQHFEILLQSIVAHPDMPIETLEMLRGEEKEQKMRKDTMYAEVQHRKLKAARRRIVTSSNEN